MPVIDGTGLTRTYGARQVLRGVQLTIRTGERVGLVGRNGSGKSSLGRILAGLEAPDAGSLARRRGARVALLAQEPRLTAGRTIRDEVMKSLGAWSEARARHEEATAAIDASPDEVERAISAQAAAAEDIERLGGWDRLHEADAVVGHLGLDDPSRLVETLSGGERRRVALAQVLVDAPDLAILDEPTNHLDIETIEWLEAWLADRYTGALLLITHDRAFLDRVTTRTLELQDGSLTSYEGGYASYLIAKAEREALAERTERNRQNFLRREVEWLRRQPKARGTKQKARIARAEEALAQQAPERERHAELRTGTLRQGKQILELQGVALEREGRRLVEGLDLALRPGQRVGVVGPNGCGKTSLLLAILGRLDLAEGEITRGTNTRVGYLDQARSDLDDRATVREAVAGDRAEVQVAGESLRVGAYLERFLFDRDAARVQVGELSGGERARVCLARLLCGASNLLIFDEPTNDLDVATLGALEGMLTDFAGSALVVSHDRWFLDRVATHILLFDGQGGAALHVGTYSEVKESLRDEAPAAAPDQAAPKGGASPAPRRAAKKLGYTERRELDGLPDRIEAAEARVHEIELALADPETYRKDGEEIARHQAALREARAEVDALTARWEELEAKQDELAG